MSNVMITMAGLGQRFRDAGYDLPKYRINAHGRTLFAWAMLSLSGFIKAGARFSFVARRADQAGGFIGAECAALGIEAPRVIELDAPTDGQATTALYGGMVLPDPEAPFMVYNIDTFVHPDALPAGAVRGDGWVPCFDGRGDGWSFAAADAHGRITELREKQRISAHATIGLYWFSSFALYRRVYREFYSDAARIEKGEKYIAPMYRQMIAEGRAVYLHQLPFDAVAPLGTPAEVHAFLQREAPAPA
jgi:hypothetical protein